VGREKSQDAGRRRERSFLPLRSEATQGESGMESTLSRTAVVIAHPDDEVLWGLPPAGATIFCCSTPRWDMERVAQFEESCAVLGCVGIMSPQAGRRFIGSGYPLKLDDLGPVLKHFDTIITHNSRGEYGHPEHVQVSEWVQAHCAAKRIRTFGYGVPAPVTALADADLERKITALQCYRSPQADKGPEPTWVHLVRDFFGGKLDNLRLERWVG
jgi:LmbE family N-acetylglucosaminyl deacetylase